jgi:hypothetical protein
MPKIIRLDQVDLPKVEHELREFKKQHDYQDWQILMIQTPHRSYSGEDDPILVVNEQNIIQPINRFSLTINAIADKLEHIAFLSIDKEVAEDKAVLALIKNLQSVQAAVA